MLMTPPVASEPNSAEPGPRVISIREIAYGSTSAVY
jgi:hypothetical protein